MEPSFPMMRFMFPPLVMEAPVTEAAAASSPPALPAGGPASAQVSATTPQYTMDPFPNPSSPNVLLLSSPRGDLHPGSEHNGVVYWTMGRVAEMADRRSETVDVAVRSGTRHRPALVRTRISILSLCMMVCGDGRLNE